jgi:perosamine synthetase
MDVSGLKSRLPSSLLGVYRGVYRHSAVFRWLREMTLRNHWRQIHTRDSCIYGSSWTPFLADLLARLVGTRQCDGHTVKHFESALTSLLSVSHLVTFSSGRNSLRAILKAMDIGEGDEVILPGFTCVVVPYTILQCGATPVYVDIRRDYRMNPDALCASLTHRTKAIIAQHTFGLPERVSDIATLTRQRGIWLIEDCAHVLPGSAHNGKALGTWGDAAYFSFERGKTLSSGWGGAAVTCDESIGRQLCQIKQGIPSLSRRDNLKIGAQLLLTILLHHPDLFALGGIVRGAMARRGVFPNAMPPSECRGDPPNQLLGRLADTQATLLLCQMQQLSSIAAHRRSCVRALSERLVGHPIDLPLMWYPLQVTKAQEAVEGFRSHQIELRRWEAPLTPPNCDTARARYRWGSCPVAEEISRGCVALPTMLNRADLDRVIELSPHYLDVVRSE